MRKLLCALVLIASLGCGEGCKGQARELEQCVESRDQWKASFLEMYEYFRVQQNTLNRCIEDAELCVELLNYDPED